MTDTVKRTLKLTPVVTGIRIDFAGNLGIDAVLQDGLGRTIASGTLNEAVLAEGSESPAELVDAVELLLDKARAYARTLA